MKEAMAVRPRFDRYGFPGGEEPRRAGRDPDEARAAEVIAEGGRDARPGEIPERLCKASVRLLPVSGGSVSLCSDRKPVQRGGSSAQARGLAGIQAPVGDGPGLDAVRVAAPVLAAALRAGGDARRW